MRIIAIIFIFLSCTTVPETSPGIVNISEKEKDQYTVLNRPEFPNDYHQIEYIGNWTHMNNLQQDGSVQTGSYASTELDTARFIFWGYGIQIRTELMENHAAYKIIIDGEFIESINVKNPTNTTHNLTYSNMELTTGNHVLELVPDGGYFVLNTLTIHYYVDLAPDLPCDSTAINWTDSIRWIIKDTTIINYRDSLILHYDTIVRRTDTVYLQPKIFIKADSIYYQIE